VATGDFNGDGNIDWVIPDGAYNNIWLYLGQGNRTSAMPTLIPLAFKLGKCWYVRRNDLERFLAHKVESSCHLCRIQEVSP
jgi:hypothetical protein